MLTSHDQRLVNEVCNDKLLFDRRTIQHNKKLLCEKYKKLYNLSHWNYDNDLKL